MEKGKKELLRLPNGENEASKKLADLYFKNEEWQAVIDGLVTIIIRDNLANEFLNAVKGLIYEKD